MAQIMARWIPLRQEFYLIQRTVVFYFKHLFIYLVRVESDYGGFRGLIWRDYLNLLQVNYIKSNGVAEELTIQESRPIEQNIACGKCLYYELLCLPLLCQEDMGIQNWVMDWGFSMHVIQKIDSLGNSKNRQNANQLNHPFSIDELASNYWHLPTFTSSFGCRSRNRTWEYPVIYALGVKYPNNSLLFKYESQEEKLGQKIGVHLIWVHCTEIKCSALSARPDKVGWSRKGD